MARTPSVIYLIDNPIAVHTQVTSFFIRNDVADSFTYIDAFNCGASHQPRSCPALIGQPRQHIRREAYATVPAEQVFLRMVNNLIQCSRVHEGSRLEENRLQNQLHFPRLACAVSPGQTPSVVAYAELCVFLGVQLGEAINLLQVINEVSQFSVLFSLVNVLRMIFIFTRPKDTPMIL